MGSLCTLADLITSVEEAQARSKVLTHLRAAVLIDRLVHCQLETIS